MQRSIVSQIFSFVGRILTRIISALLKFINRFVPWHKLPTLIGVLNLWVLRNDLRQYNLHDTSKIDRDTSTKDAKKLQWDPRYRYTRTADGTFNDLSDPAMGSAGTRFGRNFSLDHAWPNK